MELSTVCPHLTLFFFCSEFLGFHLPAHEKKKNSLPFFFFFKPPLMWTMLHRSKLAQVKDLFISYLHGASYFVCHCHTNCNALALNPRQSYHPDSPTRQSYHPTISQVKIITFHPTQHLTSVQGCFKLIYWILAGQNFSLFKTTAKSQK